MNLIKGRVWKYGDDVNTDVIFPGKYTYTLSNPKEIAKHALEDLDPEFVKNVKPNDIIVAGKNWGCGSSREQAATCLKENGLGAIIARSYGRIHYRNCINSALPAIVCSDVVDVVQKGDELEINLEAGEIKCASGIFKFPVLPENVRAIFNAGGLIEYTRRQLLKNATS